MSLNTMHLYKVVLFWLLALNAGLLAAADIVKNGFILDNTLVPADEILSGGPQRDGIPALDSPKFINADKADFLKADDRVLGLSLDGVSKAYPVNIMNWHEIVNDTFNGQPVAVTFCPLCGSGIAYSALHNGKQLSFGVSGLLYNSDVLLFDRQTESLWSQLMSQAVSGPLRGAKLQTLVLSHTSWQDWRNRHPQTLVLSDQTSFKRNYGYNPYKNYKIDRKVWFPVAHSSDLYPAKEMVLGIGIDGKYKAYPFSELRKMPSRFTDTVAGRKFSIHFEENYQTARIYNSQQQELPGVMTFWFAWYAFHPETSIFTAVK